MKRFRFPVIIALFIICCAGKCKSGGRNDYLSNLYSSAYKSYSPLKAVKDPLYAPLLGYWNLMDDRPLMVSKKDENTYEFKFLSPYLTAEDIIYEAQVNVISGMKYISMKGYNGNYMFFKMKPVDENAINFYMLNSEIRELLGEKSIVQFLQTHANLADTNAVFTKISLTRLTEQGAREMQMGKIRTGITTISEYELYLTRFPDDPGLPELKTKALDYSLTHATSVGELTDLAARYPESAEKAQRLAKEKCKTTVWCVDYSKAYPNDNAKDSILNIGFDKAKGEKDYKYLLKYFPTHQRAGKIILSLALEESTKLKTGKTQTELEEEYADIPSVIVMVNTIRIFNNFQLSENSFIKNSYVLSASGKAELDRVAGIILGVNKENVIVSDLYVGLFNNFNYGGENPKINFLQSANKCLSIRNYFESKGIKDLSVHVIPMGIPNNNSSLLNEEGHVSLDPLVAQDWKKEFYDKCYAIQQSDVIPDASRSSSLDHYIRIPELEEYILKEFAAQIPLYKNKQTYQRVIPPNYRNEEYKNSQPGFEEFNVRLLQVAKKNKLKKKYIPFFITG